MVPGVWHSRVEAPEYSVISFPTRRCRGQLESEYLPKPTVNLEPSSEPSNQRETLR